MAGKRGRRLHPLLECSSFNVGSSYRLKDMISLCDDRDVLEGCT